MFPRTTRGELDACLVVLRLAASRKDLGELVLDMRLDFKSWDTIRAVVLRRMTRGDADATKV